MYPTAGTFTSAAGMMTVTRTEHTATVFGSGTDTGKVLLAGGENDSGNAQNPAELFDPVSGGFAATASIVSAHSNHTAALLSGGTVLIAGGVDASGQAIAAAEAFDPASGSFSTTGSLVTPREQHTATLLANGHVLVTGGSNGNGNAIVSAEVYQ